jgi:hypothetical protein
VTLSISPCSSNPSISTFASLKVSPGKVGVYGLEDINAGGEPPGSPPLVGAATVSRDSPAQPVGGAGFGGGGFGFGQIVFFYQTLTKDVFIDIQVSLCSARGSISIDHKGPDTTPPSKVRSRAKSARCVATGAGYCGKQTA